MISKHGMDPSPISSIPPHCDGVDLTEKGIIFDRTIPGIDNHEQVNLDGVITEIETQNEQHSDSETEVMELPRLEPRTPVKASAKLNQ